jgi:hypothetical protein
LTSLINRATWRRLQPAGSRLVSTRGRRASARVPMRQARVPAPRRDTARHRRPAARIPRAAHRLLPVHRFHHARRRGWSPAPWCWPSEQTAARAATATPGTPNRRRHLLLAGAAARARSHPGARPRHRGRHRAGHRHPVRPALAQRRDARGPQGRRHPGATGRTATPSPASAST